MLERAFLYCYPRYEGFMFFGRKSRCMTWSIWILKRVWRYEKRTVSKMCGIQEVNYS